MTSSTDPRRPDHALRGFGADVRFGLRLLLRQPWSTLSIAATLALGIGATTAIYAVFNFVLFRPVPGVQDDGLLIRLAFQPPARTANAYGDRAALPDLRRAASSVGLEALGNSCCRQELAVAAPASGAPSFEHADFVTSQYFEVLGVRARIGRLLTDSEADTGAESVVVISERLWRSRLGGTLEALGRVININGHPFVVVGVADRFRGWDYATRVGSIDLWLPMGSQRAVTGSDSAMSFPVGRVRAGSSLAVIEQRLQAAYAAVPLPPRDHAFVPFVNAGLYQEQSAAALRLYWLLMSAVTLLLVLACANAANLLLARAARRERDTAVRLAIGAGRWRIMRQFLIESLGLAGLAGAMGLATAVVLTMALRGMRLFSYLPDLQRVEIDGRVLAFCLLVTMGTVLAFGLLPALMASRTDIRGVLGRSGRSVASPHRLRRGLVIAQIALSLTLVAGAGVLNRSLQNLFAADLGMNFDHVIELVLKPDNLGYDDRRSARVIADTLSGLERSGFPNVAVSFPNPLTGNSQKVMVKTAAMAQPESRTVLTSAISPSFFQVLRIPLLSGRAFSDAECHESEGVNPMPVVLNATMARDLFGDALAVGRTFDLDRYVGMGVLSSTALVVGVAADTRSSAVRRAPTPAIYHTRKSTWHYGTILVRSDEAMGAAMERIRAVVRDVDPALPITTLRPLRDEVAEDLSEDRVLARLSAVIAILAAMLAATGVASVISQLVTERTRDFGIRTALGASHGDILRHVLKGVVGQSVLGVALGLALYWGVSRFVATRLFGLGALDPLTIACAAIALLAIAVVAALVPARHATRIDPAVALRAE